MKSIFKTIDNIYPQIKNMLITASVIFNYQESLDESTHSWQSHFLIHDISNVINYTEWIMLDNDDKKNLKTIDATVNRQFLNNSSSDSFWWCCRLMNRLINRNQNSIKHGTAAAIDDTLWWWKEYKVHSGIALMYDWIRNIVYSSESDR